MTFAKVVLVCAVCLPAVAACGDALGPRLADPRGIAARADGLAGLFGAPVFVSDARLSRYEPDETRFSVRSLSRAGDSDG